MNTTRSVLPVKTRVKLDNGNIYEITGEPIGFGGGSIIYPAEQLLEINGTITRAGIDCALKECFPVSAKYNFTRLDSGEIVPLDKDEIALTFLNSARSHLLEEGEISRKIYHSSSRMIPTREQSSSASFMLPDSLNDQALSPVPTAVSIMDSFSGKGRNISELLREYGSLTALQTFHIARQILYAIKEIHESGFLHLDIQDGNILIKGALENESDFASIIDFGCSRPFSDGKTAVISDRMIFSTEGFTAPEIFNSNDCDLCLTPATDIFSLGCLMLMLLTGNRPVTQELISNQTGRYIPRFAIKKTKCPKHLQDRMQKILATALDKDPDKRYQSADAMLQDIIAFEELLKPQRSSLEAIDYDAFICYKHGPIDSQAAIELQKSLEHFKASGNLRAEKKYKQIKRVFVDEGEISSGSDFGAQIEAALKNAEWLIVICSEETPSSKWVHSEIKTFLKYHDRSRILAVLTGGEPETSFPEELTGTPDSTGVENSEVLAADARGESKSEVLKKLRGDALLKVAAPMLGTTFDSLKQRRRNYVLKRAFASVAVIAAAAILFAAYSIRQNIRITEATTANLLNQSRLLTEEAEKKLQNLDNVGAVTTALNAMTLGGDYFKTPILPETEEVLTRALNLYTTPETAPDFSAVYSYRLNREVEEYFVSEETHLLVARDDSSVYFWDIDTNELIDTLFIGSTLGNYSWIFKSTLLNPDTKRFVFAGDRYLYCYDLENNEVVWKVTAEGSIDGYTYSIYDIQFVETMNAYLCLENNTITFLSANDGTLLNSYKMPDEYSTNIYNKNECDLSDDGSLYAFKGLISNEDSSTTSCLIFFDTKTYSFSNILTENIVTQKLRFTEDNKLLYTASGKVQEDTSDKYDPILEHSGTAAWYLMDPTSPDFFTAGSLPYIWKTTLPYYAYPTNQEFGINSKIEDSATIWVNNKYAVISLLDGAIQFYGET